MNPIVINALLSKKAELLADAQKVCDQLDAIYESIHHLDATLETLGHVGNGQTYPRYKRPLGLFRAGELTRFLLGYLRANGPQTVMQLREAIAAEKDVDPADLHARDAIRRKIHRTLNRQEQRGTVTRDGEAWVCQSPPSAGRIEPSANEFVSLSGSET